MSKKVRRMMMMMMMTRISAKIATSRFFPAELVGKTREVAIATHPKLDISAIHTSGDGSKPSHHDGVEL